jgi:hypothetical protein
MHNIQLLIIIAYLTKIYILKKYLIKLLSNKKETRRNEEEAPTFFFSFISMKPIL